MFASTQIYKASKLSILCTSIVCTSRNCAKKLDFYPLKCLKDKKYKSVDGFTLQRREGGRGWGAEPFQHLLHGVLWRSLCSILCPAIHSCFTCSITATSHCSPPPITIKFTLRFNSCNLFAKKNSFCQYRDSS